MSRFVGSVGEALAGRLSRFFGRSERFWLNLQARYDLEIEKDRLGMELAAIEPLQVAS